MTTVTSLPELVTGVSSIRVAGSRDLALGDALGSCLFNPLLVSVVDAFYRPSACSRAPPRVMRCPPDTAAVLLAIVGVNLLVPASIPGLTLSPATLPIYALALRNVFTYERLLEPVEPALVRHPETTLRRAVTGYLTAALDLAEAMGWKSTFVGTLSLAVATSLPELVATLSAIPIGALDMAIANLPGGNLFNLVVLAIDDIAYADGPLLSHVSAAPRPPPGFTPRRRPAPAATRNISATARPPGWTTPSSSTAASGARRGRRPRAPGSPGSTAPRATGSRTPPQGLMGAGCAQCHGTETWRIAGSRHPPDSTNQCVECHRPPPSHTMMHFEMVSQRVAGQKARVDQCFACHATDDWNNIRKVGRYDHH